MASTTDEDKNAEASVLQHTMVDMLKLRGLIRTEPVERAFRCIPRHLFVPHVDLKTAYTDAPVITHERDGRPISSSSAPSVMAIMLEMLHLQPGQRVLEIGAGSGYNAALMAQIVGESGRVVTVDIGEEIAQEAREHLQTAGITNVEVICTDGGFGWSAEAPYDRIILATSSADITPAWREQLRPGGYIVLPFQMTIFDTSALEVLATFSDQYLLAFVWDGSSLESVDLRPCGFMPLRGNFVQERQKSSLSKPAKGFSSVISSPLETEEVMNLLQIPPQDEPTAVHLSFEDLSGLRLWLTLREADFCEIIVQDNTDTGLLPAQLYRDRHHRSALGLCTQTTGCFLLLQESQSEQSAERGRPFLLTLRRFGPDQALAERLLRAVTLWDQAEHPFVWQMDATMKNMHVHAQASELPYTPQPLEIVLTRPHTRFVFGHPTDTITPPGDANTKMV